MVDIELIIQVKQPDAVTSSAYVDFDKDSFFCGMDIENCSNSDTQYYSESTKILDVWWLIDNSDWWFRWRFHKYKKENVPLIGCLDV